MNMTPPVEAAIPRPKRNPATVIVTILVSVAATCLLGMIVLAAGLVPMVLRARQANQRKLGVERMKNVALANLQYSVDFDDRLPVADRWMDSVKVYVASERDFRSPDLPAFHRGSYGVAFMKTLSSVQAKSITDSATQALLFDSTLMERNAASGLETLPKPPRFGLGEQGGNAFAFVDGHAKLLTPSEQVSLK